ncbi:YebC/PmpR family DNA-binding transcriptional regulator [Sedimentitalea sp.]|uniref:YebC/PmpR family DNA-binding transcriptional regulator n=1 Tax=Sedimentitalea sp. TaxID=2048915 RepID=UPI003298B1B4
MRHNPATRPVFHPSGIPPDRIKIPASLQCFGVDFLQCSIASKITVNDTRNTPEMRSIMAKQNSKSAANDIQNLFDPQGYQGVFKTWASMNERMASIAIDAGTRANDIASETTKEALSNMRDLTKVRDEVSEYGNAYKDFVKKQAELFTRAAQNYSNETQ